MFLIAAQGRQRRTIKQLEAQTEVQVDVCTVTRRSTVVLPPRALLRLPG